MGTSPNAVLGWSAVALMMLLGGAVSVAAEPTLCDLLTKEQQALEQYLQSRLLDDEAQASGRNPADVKRLHEQRTANYQAWHEARRAIERRIEADAEVQRLIEEYQQAQAAAEQAEL